MLLLPVTIAVLLAGVVLVERWQAYSELSNMQQRLQLLETTDLLLDALRAEMGLVVNAGPGQDARFAERAAQHKAEVVAALEAVRTAYGSAARSLSEQLRLGFSNWLDEVQLLVQVRGGDGNLADAPAEVRGRYESLVHAGEGLVDTARYAGGVQAIVHLQRVVELLREAQAYSAAERDEVLSMLQSGQASGAEMLAVQRNQAAMELRLSELAEIEDFDRVYGRHLGQVLKIEEQAIERVRTGLRSHRIKIDLLAQIGSLIGFTGLIHDFKNYLLRGEEKYETGFRQKYERVDEIARGIVALPGMTESQQQAAESVVDLFRLYGGQFEVIRTMRETGVPVESIDAIVTIDNSPARIGMAELRNFRSDVQPFRWWIASTARINGLHRVQQQVYLRMGEEARTVAGNALLMLVATAMALLLVVGAVGVLATNTYRRLLMGISGTVSAIQTLATSGDLNTPLPAAGQDDEIGRLAESVRRIVDGMKALVRQAEIAGQGDFSSDVEQRSEHDALAISFNRMIANTRDLLRRAESIAGGDHDVHIELRGDNDQLGQTLMRMAASLREFSERVSIDQWLKNGQVELARVASSELNVGQLAATVTPRLTHYVGARAAAFYVMDETGEVLEASAAYAYSDVAEVAPRIAIGEGLVGACASERKLQVIDDIPADYLKIGSGLGARVPGSLVLVPIIDDQQCVGVLETAFFGKPQQNVLDFMPLAAEVIAGALQRAWARSRLDQLLEETRQQAEKLRVSEEELREQSEQLRASNEELEEKTNILEQQTDRLRQSEEELQAQSEELQAANEELEERSRLQEQYNQELQKRAEEIARANQYKSEFLANMSHELRTPLNSMLILSKMLADNEDGNLNEDEVESAKVVHESGTNLLNLINEILDLSKVESGKVELHFEPHDLRRMLTGLGKRYRPLAEQRGIRFDVEVHDDVPQTLMTDGMRLEQVITNLLSNAFKFTHEGGVTMLVEKDSGRLPGGDAIAFRVRDSGIGIPQDKLDKVFRAFEQVDGSTTRKYGGTGLGLAISRQLAQHLGGDLDVISREGEGSTFSVYLPIEASAIDAAVAAAAGADDHQQEHAARVEAASSAAGGESTNSYTVMDDRDSIAAGERCVVIIEDDPGFARVLMKTARERGLKGVVAHDGPSGIDLVRRFRPIGVLLDIGLPGADGWAVMAQLKGNSDTRHIPVHFLSGEEHAQRALAQGAIGFATKPVSREAIGDLLNRIEALDGDARRRVLVLERNDEDRALILSALSDDSAEVVEADTVQGALDLLEAESFHCVVLNCRQGDDSSRDFLRQAGERDISLPPVIVHSPEPLSDAERADLERCYASSMVLKNAASGEVLLDEVTLFLHHVRGNKARPEPSIAQVADSDGDVLREKTVLLVDDDMRNVFALAKVLRSKGMKVLKAQDGMRALNQIQDHKESIDLVLMDIMMPEMDGYECMRRIREIPGCSDLPVIALTAKAMKGDRKKCLDAGASDYLTKPVDMPRLLSMMRTWLS